jgi:very-short-patch-repair endonuclease
MEKECNLCKKIYNTKNKKQKYCSVECQHNSYKVQKTERVTSTCKFCGKDFLILPYKIKDGKGKYCSRECKDTHQKYIYSGQSNPLWGRKHTNEWKKQLSERTKKNWQSEEYRNKVKNSILKFFEKNGYHPGTNQKSKEKRKKTMIEKYGVEHNWKGKYGQRKCDKTTLEIYGKSAAQMLIEYTHYFNKKTDIEQIFENILIEVGIPFQMKYRLYDKKKINFWFREYDFFILDSNILIEVDGDYWHGNENIFENLSDFQKQIKENDIVKENFAISKGFRIIRFWGSEVKENKEQIKNKLLKLWEELK